MDICFRVKVFDAVKKITLVCKIPLLERALGLKAEQRLNKAVARPSVRTTTRYLVYNWRAMSTFRVKNVRKS